MTRLSAGLGLALLVLGSAAATGCASAAGTPRGAPTSPRVAAPVLLTSTRPEWKYSTPMRDGKVLDLRVEVQIDAEGRPDMQSLRVTGLGASENRDVIEAWLGNARFRPAQQAGQNVAATFEERFEVRVSSRRVRL